MLTAIRKTKRPLALTGAGISAPSGVPTFQGGFRGKPVRAYLSRRYLRAHPAEFFSLFCQMEAWSHAAPNPAHRALADLDVPIVTQNIDGLHQRAGSRRVLELHGSVREMVCPACGRRAPSQAVCALLRVPCAAGDGPAVLRALRCPCGGQMDTDVVLYDDAVRGLEQAVDRLMAADALFVIGTSLITYPAASLPEMARERGMPVYLENTDCVWALTE